MSEIKIEYNIQVSPKLGPGLNPWRELCRAMKVIEKGKGDSVLLNRKQANSMRTSALQQGMKLTIREQPDGRFRVWRLK